MTSILELVEGLVRDPHAKADYAADPEAYLERHGFGDLEEDDITEALGQAADSFPPALAAQVVPSAGLGSLTEVQLDDLGLADVDDFSGGRLDDAGSPAATGEAATEAATSPVAADEADIGAQAGAGAGPDEAGDRLSADVEFDRADPTDARPGSSGAARDGVASSELDAAEGPTGTAGGTDTVTGPGSGAGTGEPLADRGGLLDDLDGADAAEALRGAGDGLDDQPGGLGPAGASSLDDLDAARDLDPVPGEEEGPWRPVAIEQHDQLLGHFDGSDTADLDDL